MHTPVHPSSRPVVERTDQLGSLLTLKEQNTYNFSTHSTTKKFNTRERSKVYTHITHTPNI